MHFKKLTITGGDKFSERVIRTRDIPVALKEYFGEHLKGTPLDIKSQVSVPGYCRIKFHATANEPTCCFLTLTAGDELATTGIVLTGLDPGEDLQCLSEFQAMLDQVFRAMAVEAGRAVMGETDRPLMACVIWPNPAVSPEDFARTGPVCIGFAAAFIEAAFTNGPDQPCPTA
jgi:hypothetical protein